MTKVLRMGYAAPATLPLVCPQGRPRSIGVCLLRSIRTVADLSAVFESLGSLLSRHRALTRVSLAALSFTLIVAVSQQTVPASVAGPDPVALVPESLLPQNVGVGVASDESITIPFESAVDPDAVEAALQVLPAQKVRLAWNDDRTELSISPERLWRTDERYLVVVPADVTDAEPASGQSPRRFSFTTQIAPGVTDFQVRLASPPDDASEEAAAAQTLAIAADDPSDADAPEDPGTLDPERTAQDVSATSAITISFSEPMDAADVERHFNIAPKIDGDLSWKDGSLVFEPSGRLEPGSRYTISLIGSHDRVGNLIGGKGNFSFIVQPGAQVTKTQPEIDATDVEPATVEMWFSQPMDVDRTNEAFALTDTSNGALVGGLLNWNDAETQLIYTPDNPFAGGRTFEVSIGKGARDADGNPVSVSWSFATKAAPVVAAPAAPAPVAPARTSTTTRSAPAVPPAAPATSLAGYALNQVNAARAAYGFAPVVLDAAVSAAASAHAMDQATNNYFSHYSLDGRSREDRLRAAGVGFSWSGENQCYHIGMSQQATLDWCHAQFMAEPYPGHWNHIANILNPNARRMGVGIATVGGKTIITWNFTD
jgi:uncharacterized protein YkwD